MKRAARSPASTVTLVVAAAGYGKTTWAESHAPAEVVEDLHLRSDVDQVELLRELGAARGDDAGPLILTSRIPLSPKVRATLRGPVRDRGPQGLALTPQSVATVLSEEYSVSDPEIPTRLHRITAGWPELVHLAADAASRGLPSDAPDALEALARTGSAIGSWVEHDLLPSLPERAGELLVALAPLDLLAPDLVERFLDLPADEGWAREGYADLVRLGLLVPHPRDELLGRERHRLVPLVASAVNPSDPSGAAWRRAAEWYDEHDAPFAAVDAFERAGDGDRARLLLAERGSRMIAQGDAAGVVAFVTDAGAVARDLDPGVRRTLGEAVNTTGDGFAALGVLAPLATEADRQGWDADLAALVAAVHFSQGDLPRARDVLDRVSADALPDRGVGVLWRATRVNVESMLGGDATDLAAQTLALAEASGDPADLVAAHQAMAKASSGSRKAAHLRLALTQARRSGDVVALARILGNQAYALLAAGRCEEAVAVGREAVRATELVRPMGALTAALHNLAEALARTGEYAEARWHLRRAAAVSQRIGPNRAASSLVGLGEVHRALGQREQGRAAYQEAITLARASQERQVLVPALAGLARLVLDETPDEARLAAEEAVALATPALAPYALVALGWVELAAGDPARAVEHAAHAAAAAREQQAVDLLADALELVGAADDDLARARGALEESLSIWEAGGAGPDADRIRVLLGRLGGADRAARERGREAAERLQRLGVARVHGRSLSEDPVGRDVAIRVLGRFEVAVGRQPVTLQAWKSRQARTLVKVLAARRGRPVSRGELCEVLWPNEDPAKTSHRLSVLLTTVRGVFDPAKAWPPDRYLASDARGVWLDLRRVGIDADDVVTEAEHGAGLLADGAVTEAAEVLTAVDARYRGAVFEDEPYEDWLAEDWAVAFCEETRAAWLRSLRHLATVATQQGRSNDASAILIRLLGVDPYDERVHRGLVRNLVRAGRHGEARRAFDRWATAMTAVDAPPPDPSELVPRPRESG